MNKHEFDGEEGLGHVGEDDDVFAYYAAAVGGVCTDSTKPRPRSHVDNCSQLNKFSLLSCFSFLYLYSLWIAFVILFNSCQG